MVEHPRIYGMILYVEQPFPYDLEEHAIDVHGVAARKPLFMDESAHDWRLVRRGRELGWTGVALKTCKTQTGALLSLCWARAHGMTLMVQDLTNPMLAQIAHALLAAHAGTIMGFETNSMQFYPAVSAPEAAVHPGLYRRRNGEIDLTSIHGPGFGYGPRPHMPGTCRNPPRKGSAFHGRGGRSQGGALLHAQRAHPHAVPVRGGHAGVGSDPSRRRHRGAWRQHPGARLGGRHPAAEVVRQGSGKGVRGRTSTT